MYGRRTMKKATEEEERERIQECDVCVSRSSAMTNMEPNIP
jgi:hypothetical protein